MNLPRIIKAAVVVTFFNSWILFEETVIDRSGLWAYLPYYEKADPCLWDLGAFVLIAVVVWRALGKAQ